jgi:hypothetical protein
MFSDGEDMAGCQLTGVYHLADDGWLQKYHPGKSVGGLSFVLAHRPEALIKRDAARMSKDERPVAKVLYVPEGLAPNQEEAIRLVYVEYLLSLMAPSRMEMRRAPIRFRPLAGGDAGYEVEIPGILRARTEPIRGDSKRQMAVDNVAFAEGSRWLLGRATRHTYTDPKERAWRWDLRPGTNGAWCRFTWPEIDHG